MKFAGREKRLCKSCLKTIEHDIIQMEVGIYFYKIAYCAECGYSHVLVRKKLKENFCYI